jgi:glycosyltransferase involved in cell wall biosynthesis
MASASSPQIAPELLLPLRNGQLLRDVALPKVYVRPWMKERVLRYIRPCARRFITVPSRYALWHATSQCTKYLPLDPRVPMVLTIHDLNFLREEPPEKIAANLRRVQALVDRAAAITTISHFVASEVREHLELEGKPLRVIYNGLAAQEHPDAARPAFIGRRPFLLSLSDISRKKNFHVLIALLTRLPEYSLVVAGNDRNGYAGEIRRMSVAAGVADRVVLPGVVSDATRCWLYRSCAAFLFPSLTEGFGLPVVEAMSFGKPVFLSRCTSLPEIGGPLAFYWQSFRSEHMFRVFQHSMAVYAKDATYPARLTVHAKQFSWAKAAAEYLNLYGEVLDSQQAAPPWASAA